MKFTEPNKNGAPIVLNQSAAGMALYFFFLFNSSGKKL